MGSKDKTSDLEELVQRIGDAVAEAAPTNLAATPIAKAGAAAAAVIGCFSNADGPSLIPTRDASVPEVYGEWTRPEQRQEYRIAPAAVTTGSAVARPNTGALSFVGYAPIVTTTGNVPVHQIIKT